MVTALLDTGLAITGLVEHDSVPDHALPGQMRLREDSEYVLHARSGVMPLSYTLQAVAPGA